MKEKSVADELAKLAEFKNTRSEWFLKDVKEKKTRGGKKTPKVQTEEGSFLQPKKKRQKKAVETMLVDEPEEDEAEADAERDQGRLSPESAQLLKSLKESFVAEKAVGEEGGNEEQSSSSSDSEVDETEHWKKVVSEKEKQKKRKRSGNDHDDLYVPSLEHVQDVQAPPSSGGRKKSNARKRVVTPKVARRLKVVLKSKPIQEPSQPPSPPPEPQQQPSPHQSPPAQQPDPIPSPPKQPTPPHLSSPPQSSSQLHISTPTHE
ncbi:hypothetical protein HanPI659440_Chr17g0696501 [Helianthus annuus]|nr:hypothetical protein HanPI659440_Chr17g0696501 [Helianthus annuus]